MIHSQPLRQCYAMRGWPLYAGVVTNCYQFFALIAWHLRTGEPPNRGWRMLVNLFSNDTTVPRVKTAEGVSIVDVALTLSLMAAIVALVFVARGTLNA